MNELVERLEELRTQATPGPWKPDVQEGVRGHCILAQIWDSEGFSLAIIDTKDEASVANANAALITTLVNNLDTIIAALRERDMVRVPQSFLRQLPQPEGRIFLSEYDANAEGITQYWAYERGCAHALAMVAERVNTVLPASPTLTMEGGE